MIMRLMSVVWLVSASANAQEKPPLPYYDWGACPFECCTYREWETTKRLDVHTKRSNESAIAFRLGTHENVTGLTGVVITKRYGVTRILKRAKIGYTTNETVPQLSLKAGEAVYTLHYLGEGHDLFWYQGKTYSDQVSVTKDSSGNVPFDSTFEDEYRPETEWWVKLKNADGQIGWSGQTDSFAHMDRCE